MKKKTKNFMIYSIGGIALLIFTYGLTLLRSLNDGVASHPKQSLQYLHRS